MRSALLLALLALATSSTACGGGDDEPAAGGAAPAATEARHRAALDGVCAAHARDVQRLSLELTVPQRFADQGPYDRGRADALRTQADGLAALEPPASLRPEHETLVGAARAYAEAYGETARLAEGGDEAAWRASVPGHQRQGAALLDAAAELDLRACARRPSPAVAADVRAVVERVLLGGDPDGSCTRDVTPAFLASNLSGTRERCRQALAGLRGDGATLEFVEAVGVDGITGVDGVIASANVLFTGSRERPARRFVYDLVFTDGRWRLDSAFEPPAGGAQGA